MIANKTKHIERAKLILYMIYIYKGSRRNRILYILWTQRREKLRFVCIYVVGALRYTIYTQTCAVSYRIIDENNVEKTLYDVVAYSADLRTFFVVMRYDTIHICVAVAMMMSKIMILW